MLRAFVNEGLMDLRGFFKGWKLVILLLWTGFAVIMSFAGGEDMRILMIGFASWTSLSMNLKIRKMHYLLPGEEQYRIINVLVKCVGVLLFNMVWYVIFTEISVVISGYRFQRELRHMFCEMLPYFISYISLSMNNGYNILPSENDGFSRKNNLKQIMAVVFSILPVIFSTLLSNWLHGTAYTIFTVLSYLVAILVLRWEISIFQHTNTCYENIKKPGSMFI